jgi:hypothetical protein
MSSRGVAPSNDAFAGGAQQRNLYPPGVGGANLSANTRVNSPAAGVAPGQIKSALNNSTSNIGIPYQRLVPLNNSNKLIGTDEHGKTVVRKETEDLRATSLAFILGIRGDSKPPRMLLAGNEQAPGVPGHNVAYQPDIMPAMVGTERFQQLCSIEYLHEYFKQVLAGKTIALDTTYADATAAMQGALKTSGPISVYNAAAHEARGAGIPPNEPGRPNIAPDDTLLKMPDLAKQMGLAGSDASEALENHQGIFARDFGPFLKGKGSKTELVHGTMHNLPQPYNPEQPDLKKRYSAQPFCLSRNFGDDVAFSLLDAKLLENGITDWRPDGIVLSKGINDPSDQLSNEYLEARDGQLFNVRIQGPAVGSAWTGERSLEVLPLDKVFVVVVADVWFDAKSATKYDASVEPGPNGKGGRQSAVTIADLMGRGIETTDDVRDYQVLRTKYLKEELDEEAFKTKQRDAFQGKEENTVLANFRVMVSTSSQMINHSTFKSKGNKQSDVHGKRRKLTGGSRMSLTLSNDVGEYIVGGWQVGAVMDTAASRGSMPQGASLGIRSAPNSAAMNINVNISWYNADRLCRSFNNPEGTIKQRFETVASVPNNPVNMQLSKDGWSKLVRGADGGAGGRGTSSGLGARAARLAGAAAAGALAADGVRNLAEGAGAIAELLG